MSSSTALATRPAWFAAAALVVGLIGSCSGDDTSPAEASTPSTDAASEVPSSTSASDRVLVSGSMVCDFTSDIAEQEKGRVSIFTATMACTDEASDPRVSGQDEFELTETEFLGGGEDINWFRLEEQTLTTEGGTWRGEGFGSEFVDPDDGFLYTTGYSTLYGERAYEGLVYHQLYAQSPDTEDRYLFAGWIEPAP